ncbi:hypothetical protein Syun_001175 [Stephania yunnanensis]|uniref:CCHC-type domain-containing protein n=1 Tax=Stephania yunnanensis TaxID=152371 RepID=A0AAP0LG52_9MAGN
MWIGLLKLPFEFYDENMLERIGSGPTSTSGANFFVREMKVPVVYKGLHKVCFSCGRFGHRQTDCSNETLDKLMKDGRSPMEKGEDALVEVHAQDMSHLHRPPSSDASLPSKEAPSFGPWMITQRRRRP